VALLLVITSPLPAAVDPQAMQRAVELLSNKFPETTGSINLKLVDDAEITALNKQYSGNAYATDVLSFSYIENGPPLDSELGDVAISLPTAEKQAKAAQTDLTTELTLLTLHGSLHVLGLDHQNPNGQQRFEQLQTEIMQSLGLKYRNFDWL
jgi:probable rRNA maturation factor